MSRYRLREPWPTITPVVYNITDRDDEHNDAGDRTREMHIHSPDAGQVPASSSLHRIHRF